MGCVISLMVCSFPTPFTGYSAVSPLSEVKERNGYASEELETADTAADPYAFLNACYFCDGSVAESITTGISREAHHSSSRSMIHDIYAS